MTKGFIPIIFIVIGAVVVASATFGVVKYKDEIATSAASIVEFILEKPEKTVEETEKIEESGLSEETERAEEQIAKKETKTESKPEEEKLTVIEKIVEKVVEKPASEERQVQDQESDNENIKEENPVSSTIEAYFYKDSIPADGETITKIEARVLDQFDEGMSEQLVSCTLPNGLVFKGITNSYGFVYFGYQSTGNIGMNAVYIESDDILETIEIEETLLPEPESEPQKESEPEPEPEIIEEEFTYTLYEANTFGIGEHGYDTYISFRTSEPIQHTIQLDIIGKVDRENTWVRDITHLCRGACDGSFYEIVLDDLYYSIEYQVKIYVEDREGNILIDDMTEKVFRIKD